MKRPELHPDNAAEVYPYYKEQILEQARRRARPMLKTVIVASSVLFRPTVDFPESARAAVRSATGGKNGLIFTSNHSDTRDFFVLASLAQREKEINDLLGNHFVLAASALWKWFPGAGKVFDGIGGIPVFRGKEFPGVDRSDATDQLVTTSAELLAEGLNMAILPQGSRYASEMKSGIGRIACTAMELGQAPVQMLPLAMYHSEEQGSKKSYVSIGAPFEAPATVDAVVAETEGQLAERYEAAQNLATQH